MPRILILSSALALTAMSAAAQDGECVEGMRWSVQGDERPVAIHSRCDGGEVMLAAACQGGEIRMAVGSEMSDTAPGEAVALDLSVDGESYTLAGEAHRSRGAVRPNVAVDATALEALIRGARAAIALPEGSLDMHLAGSARALAPVRDACAP